MEAKIIDGKSIAKEIREELREEIKEWMKKENHRAPQVTAVLVGEDPSAQTYAREMTKAAQDVGITSSTKLLPTSTSEAELLKVIADLNADVSVDAILILLPLPEHINEQKIFNSVSCAKDVDGLNEKNVGKLCSGAADDALVPCTALAAQELLKRSQIETIGKHVVVVGCSKYAGTPIMLLFHSKATVTSCHRSTPPDELKRVCKVADIIVSAAGVPKLITADMIKPGAAVIDTAFNQVQDEKTGKQKFVGDVDFEEVKKVAGFVTPVPGGVGPMTVAMLMRNTFVATKKGAGSRTNI